MMHEIDEMLLLQLEGKHDEARALSDKLERIGKDKILDPNGKNTQDIWLRHCFNRGWFILQEGDYVKGCQFLEHGRFLDVYGSPPLRTDAPLFNPQIHDIRNKSIIISLEGGFGDEIIHARFATSFKKLGAKHVYLAASPELVTLLERIEGVDKVILRNQVSSVSHDYWAPGFSAGWLAGHDFNNFPGHPYLTPTKNHVEVWETIIQSDKIKVGIRWAGNPKFEHQQFRRFPENFITNLSKYPELQLYSLQRDQNLVELPENIIDLQHQLISWEDTAAAIMNLDIVITSCTSVAHLSAALGKETWIMVPILPYHTWTYKAPFSRVSPYYDSVRLFRQTKKLKWNDTFQLLYKELEERFNLTHIDQPNEDRVEKRINLGCGLAKVDGFLNVDNDPLVKPDQVVDLNQFPWPFEDNEFNHVLLKNILEYLGDTGEDFAKVIQELYRISCNDAIWEVQTPHWRSDTIIDDPLIKRKISVGTFKLFDKMNLIEKYTKGMSDSNLAFKYDVDLDLVDFNFEYTAPWKERTVNNNVKQEELIYAANHLNNAIQDVQYLIQVHKPGRVDLKEFTAVVEKRNKNKIKLEKHSTSGISKNV